METRRTQSCDGLPLRSPRLRVSECPVERDGVFSKCVLGCEDEESQSPTDGVAIPRINDQFGFLRLIRGLATPSVGQESTLCFVEIAELRQA